MFVLVPVTIGHSGINGGSSGAPETELCVEGGISALARSAPVWLGLACHLSRDPLFGDEAKLSA
jgi:hypothetical protein